MVIKDVANHKLRRQLWGRDESLTKDLIIIKNQVKILGKRCKKPQK